MLPIPTRTRRALQPGTGTPMVYREWRSGEAPASLRVILATPPLPAARFVALVVGGGRHPGVYTEEHLRIPNPTETQIQNMITRYLPRIFRK